MTWTAPEITRVNGPLAAPTGDERTLADAWLDLHRQTLLWKCGGLTSAQLKPAPSSGRTCHCSARSGTWPRWNATGSGTAKPR